MPSAAAAALADLAPALDALDVRWYVFGAQAAIYYGSPRTTADIDVTVELASVAPPMLIDRLTAAGIVPRFPFDETFVLRTRVLPMLHRASGMGVDIVLAGPGPEETFLANAREVRFEGVLVRMASPTDIVVMKTIAGRPKDVDDIVALMRVAPEGLDLLEARALVADLATLLDQSDLLRVFDAARARAGRSTPRSPGRKRSRKR